MPKKTTQTEDAPRYFAWSTEEEITLCKGWVHHKKALDHQTYDTVNGKWKTMRQYMDRFFGVHANVMRMALISGAKDENYFTKALFDYEAEYRVPFTLNHCWEVLRKSPKEMDSVVLNFKAKKRDANRYKSFDSISFNKNSRDASNNLNVDGRDEEDKVQEVKQPMGRDIAKGLKKKGAGESGHSKRF
uniref:Uncharacterized protein n=1 Tax=Tanacetum cinerariifolium TaxID=118510 RepID=A0A6L2NUH4_TANCI|nr:hypothetical protein [Tanacetum cinerariifolium]